MTRSPAILLRVVSPSGGSRCNVRKFGRSGTWEIPGPSRVLILKLLWNEHLDADVPLGALAGLERNHAGIHRAPCLAERDRRS